MEDNSWNPTEEEIQWLLKSDPWIEEFNKYTEEWKRMKFTLLGVPKELLGIKND